MEQAKKSKFGLLNEVRLLRPPYLNYKIDDLGKRIHNVVLARFNPIYDLVALIDNDRSVHVYAYGGSMRKRKGPYMYSYFAPPPSKVYNLSWSSNGLHLSFLECVSSPCHNRGLIYTKVKFHETGRLIVLRLIPTQYLMRKLDGFDSDEIKVAYCSQSMWLTNDSILFPKTDRLLKLTLLENNFEFSELLPNYQFLTQFTYKGEEGRDLLNVQARSLRHMPCYFGCFSVAISNPDQIFYIQNCWIDTHNHDRINSFNLSDRTFNNSVCLPGSIRSMTTREDKLVVLYTDYNIGTHWMGLCTAYPQDHFFFQCSYLSDLYNFNLPEFKLAEFDGQGFKEYAKTG
jgi:hypothetical protein